MIQKEPVGNPSDLVVSAGLMSTFPPWQIIITQSVFQATCRFLQVPLSLSLSFFLSLKRFQAGCHTALYSMLGIDRNRTTNGDDNHGKLCHKCWHHYTLYAS